MKNILKIIFAFICFQSFGQENTVDIKKFGVLGNGSVLETEKIQKAIDETSKKGTILYFSTGTYLTGNLFLKNNSHLFVSELATIKGSSRLIDYPTYQPKQTSTTDAQAKRYLIFGEDLENITIEGKGMMDFSGKSPEFIFKHKDTMNRPMGIRLIKCTNVLLKDINLKNSALWMQQYLQCKNLRFEGINVFNHANRENDGLDIDNCENVMINNCIIDSDDDALCFKSSSADTCKNVTVTNCILSSNCNPIKFGTGSIGGFKKFTITNCVIKKAAETSTIWVRNWALAGIALEIVDGGTMEDIVISNITMEDVMTPIFMRLGNRGRVYGDIATPSVGKMRNVIISNIISRSFRPVVNCISAIPGFYIENVTLSIMHFDIEGGGTKEMITAEVPEIEKGYPENKMFGKSLPAFGFYVRHAQNISFDHIKFNTRKPDQRPCFYLDDVKNCSIDHVFITNNSYSDNFIGISKSEKIYLGEAINAQNTFNNYVKILNNSKEVFVKKGFSYQNAFEKSKDVNLKKQKLVEY